MMDVQVFRAWITSAAEVIEANRDHLTQLDAAIGDADHGVNLARGFAAVLGALGAGDHGAAARMTPGKILTLTGSTLISNVGGAAGPLYGTAFRQAGKALGSAADVDLPALSAALQAALAGVQRLGAAREGDKTMVDALVPATRALSKAIAEGASPDEALSALAEAAAAGAVATTPMRAWKGRASYLGPRSVGHEDPGAVSTALILGALRDAARAGRDGAARAGRDGAARAGRDGAARARDDRAQPRPRVVMVPGQRGPVPVSSARTAPGRRARRPGPATPPWPPR